MRHFLRLEYQAIAELSSRWPIQALCREMLVGFRIGDAEDVPAAVAGYVKFFNEERPMCCLGYMTPKQYREASLKRDPRPLPPYQCRHLPTVVYPKLNLMATND